MQQTETQSLTDLICDLVGYEKLDELCSRLGGLRWKIPMHPPVELRNQRIREEFRMIMAVKQRPAKMGTYRALARKYRLSVPQIRRILDKS